jgi:Acetyl-coenzyme A synthetase N-terminus
MTTHPAAPGGEPIWRPGPEAAASSAIARFGRYVTERTEAELGTYLDLHRWSTGQLEQFWGAVWDFLDIAADGRHADVLADAAMPGARWFPGTRLNYAEHALRHGEDDTVAVAAVSEDGTTTRTTGRSCEARSRHWPGGCARPECGAAAVAAHPACHGPHPEPRPARSPAAGDEIP